MTDTAAAGGLEAFADEFYETDALPVLSEYVRIPCLSPEFDRAWEENGHLRAAADLLADFASHREISGLKVEVVSLPSLSPVILAEAPATAGFRDGAATTVLYGHLDKQPPFTGWREGLGPFEPVREGDRLYGRGVADDGYSLFCALGALEILERAGRGHGRSILIVEASEESGSSHLAPYLDLLSDRLAEAPGLVVCLDSGAMSYDRLWTTTSLRGLVGATIRVDVLTEGIHSGGGGGVVPDSFRLLRQLLDRIEDAVTGEVLLEGCRVEVPAQRRREADELAGDLGEAALDRFPTVPGLRLANGASVAEALLRRTWSASIAAVGMDGMPALEDAGNVIRPHTSCHIAMRIPPAADAGAVADELRQRLEDEAPDGARVAIEGLGAAPGFNAPEMAPWLKSACEEASRAYFGAGPGHMGEGGTIPFLSTLLASYPKAQFLVTGVLGPESNAHGPNEMLHIPTAKALTASVAEVLSRAAVS